MRIEKIIAASLIIIFAAVPQAFGTPVRAADPAPQDQETEGAGIAVTELKMKIPKFPSGFQDRVFLSEEDAQEVAAEYTYNKYKDVPGDHSLTVSSGITVSLSAKIRPYIHTLDPLVWTSDNEDVATVTSEGSLTALSPGTAVISVSDINGQRSDTLMLTVLSGTEKDLETFDSVPGFALARQGICANLGAFPSREDLIVCLWHHKGSPSYKPTYTDVYNARYMSYDMGLFPEEKELSLTLTRGDLAYALWKFTASPEPRPNSVFANIKDVPEQLSDIDTSDPTYDAAMWAVQERLIKPYKGDSFAPEYTVTKEFFTETLYKYAVRYSHITNINNRNIFDKNKDSKKLKDNGTWKKITGAKLEDTKVYELAMEYVMANQDKHKYKYKYGSNNITGGEVDCSAFVTHIYKTLLETVTYSEKSSSGAYKDPDAKTKTPYMVYNGYKNWSKYRGTFEYYRTSTKPLKSGIYEMVSENDYQYVFVDKYGIADLQHMTVARWGAYLSSLGVTASGVMKVKTNENITGDSWKWLAEGNYHIGDIVTFGDKMKRTANGNPYLYSDDNYKHMAIFAGYYDINDDGIREALIFHSSSKIPGSYDGFDSNFSGVMLSDITTFTRLYNEKECNVQIYRILKDVNVIDPTPTPTPIPTPEPET